MSEGIEQCATCGKYKCLSCGREYAMDEHFFDAARRERLYLAGRAMQGLIPQIGEYSTWRAMAHDALEAADAVLAELEKEKP